MGLSCLGITAGLSKGLQCPHAVTCFQTHADPGEEDSCWDFLPRDSPSAALHPTWLKPPGLPQSSGDPEPELTSHREKSEDEGPWELSLVRVGLGGCTFQSLATKERNVSQGTYGTQCGVLGMNHPQISFCNKSTLQGKGTVEGPPQQDWSGGRSGKGRWSAKECVISPGPSEGRPQRELHITAKLFTLWGQELEFGHLLLRRI